MKTKGLQWAGSASPERNTPPCKLMKVDPRALKDNGDNTRQSKWTPQADALFKPTLIAPKAAAVVSSKPVTGAPARLSQLASMKSMSSSLRRPTTTAPCTR